MEMDKGQLIEELKSRLADVEPLPDDPEFFTSHETIVRYLKARDWHLKESEKLLRTTIEWRRKLKPLTMDCVGCHDKPGMHPIRQIGFDEMGRPVMYFCFAQASVSKNTVESTVMHSTYLVENAKRTMRPGVTTWVMVMDCRGMTLPACNPKLGYGATQVLSNYYPERLGLVICLHHNALFQGVWKAIKMFLHPNTIAKMKLVRSKRKIKDLFEKAFPDELTHWLSEEMRLNKQSPLPMSQKQFWRPPPFKEAHDPRGCPSYVRDHIEPYLAKAGQSGVHKPHPNIIDYLESNMNVLSLSVPGLEAKNLSPASAGANGTENSDDDDDVGSDDDITIDEEFQIPKDATPLHM